MPNIKSAKKRVKVIETKTLQNKMHRSALKTEMKKYDAALASGDMAAAQAAYKEAVKKVYQAAAYGIIHKNAAAHKKSQFTKKLNALNKYSKQKQEQSPNPTLLQNKTVWSFPCCFFLFYGEIIDKYKGL